MISALARSGVNGESDPETGGGITSVFCRYCVGGGCGLFRVTERAVVNFLRNKKKRASGHATSLPPCDA